MEIQVEGKTVSIRCDASARFGQERDRRHRLQGNQRAARARSIARRSLVSGRPWPVLWLAAD
jgi:hypothetical protein